MNILPKIVVITATTGRETLIDTIDSIQKQSYPNIKHIIVCDGTIHEERTKKIVANYKLNHSNTSNDSTKQPAPQIELLTIPWQTGLNDWVCHRIYAAMPHIIVEDNALISYLDEDNFIDPEHYTSLYEEITKDNKDWVYSLRKIVTQSRDFLVYDMCESLGYLSQVWIVLYQIATSEQVRKEYQESASYYLVDTNCYLIRKDILQKVSHNFQRPARQHPEGDRRLFYDLWKNYKGSCTMQYTLNYRLDGRRGNPTDSAIPEFYEKGNSFMATYYNNQIPWAPK